MHKGPHEWSRLVRLALLMINVLGIASAWLTLCHGDTPVTVKHPSAEHVQKIAKLIDALDERQHSIRLSAMKKLGNHGAAAKAAVPALGKVLRGTYKELSEQAARSLAQIGTEAVGELASSLDSSSAAVLGRVLAALRLLGPAAAQATSAVSRLLEHSDPKIRAQAAQVLGEIGPRAGASAPALQKALRDPDPQVRILAGHALHEIGLENLAMALPLLRDENIAVRLNV